jgi:hypothetical protein
MFAIAIFIFDAGIETVEWRAIPALRMRVSISPIGSLTLTALLLKTSVYRLLQQSAATALVTHYYNCRYQLDLVTPGIIPFSAFSRKQIRHMPNRRI